MSRSCPVVRCRATSRVMFSHQLAVAVAVWSTLNLDAK